ncbi:hypothetical protein [Alkanindiges illinoisensis]|uniref:Uncharacterized protein n=1 Tax=Alkanindiges illinoisensis TaxID=197183 RepID=A0A4Y7XEL4_9GAMM|nr:hypothetical protein [Alkanindiges illinoisensis]TEU30104.1 hypothetical protein E2B99_03430 [Alkanindiges illinoisensis]
MSIEASQLIANLGGRAAAHQIRKQAPIGTAYIAQYQLADDRITHYYDDRFRLYQDGHWAFVGIQQYAGIKNNSMFTTQCELRDLHKALETLPAANLDKTPDCLKCSNTKVLLTACQDHVVRLAEQNLNKCNGRFWWRATAIFFFALNIIQMATGQGWSL